MTFLVVIRKKLARNPRRRLNLYDSENREGLSRLCCHELGAGDDLDYENKQFCYKKVCFINSFSIFSYNVLWYLAQEYET